MLACVAGHTLNLRLIMKNNRWGLGVVTVVISFVTLVAPLISAEPIFAEVALPALAVREVKIKGDDFMVLQATADVQLGEYWLGYSSSDPLESLTPEYQLASGTLGTNEAVVLVGDSAVPTCDAVLAMDMPVALAETKGAVALWRQVRSSDGKTITFNFVDGFTWTNAKTGVADIVRPTTVEDGLMTPTWFRQLATGGTTWQVGDLAEDAEQGCVLRSKTQVVLGAYTVANDASPPAVIEGSTESEVTPVGAEAPVENVGLLAPQITELLPNPAGTGTDTTDEFVELYNPNNALYDLSGYTLQTGLTTKHSYVFPEGTVLGAQSFVSFDAAQTGLSMSNTSGQVTLLAPDGIVIAQSDPYGTAADGKAWALADGTWYWTITPTSGASNIIATNPVAAAVATVKKAAKAATTTAKNATAKTGTAKAAKVTAAKKTTTKSPVAVAKVASEATKPVRGLHPLVLALVAAAALGYGLYEYRHDLANAFHKFRTDRAARRSHRG